MVRLQYYYKFEYLQITVHVSILITIAVIAVKVLIHRWWHIIIIIITLVIIIIIIIVPITEGWGVYSFSQNVCDTRNEASKRLYEVYIYLSPSACRSV